MEVKNPNGKSPKKQFKIDKFFDSTAEEWIKLQKPSKKSYD
uniref:Uncharacterized protein n=1 Tax=Lepeophtheirus salmonis TaxID=72036 RepID=A0A0K2V9C6_LEPSM